MVGACPRGTVVLLDDVITTGATAMACAAVLGEVTVLAFTATV
jgi:predicted amidophosphoribosyltransferase